MIEIADEEIDLTKRNLKMKEQEKARIKGNNKILDIKSLVTPNKEIVAYRFYLATGTFDIRRDVALKYGINVAPKKGVQLYEKKGIIATKHEFNTHKLIPDISNNVEDIHMLLLLLQAYIYNNAIQTKK